MGDRNTKDLVGGAILATIGTTFAVDSFQYGIGSALRMGAGFFPLALGGVTVLIGLSIVIKGFGQAGRLGSIAWRSLASIVAGLSAFALIVDVTGLIPALAAAVLLVSLGDPDNKLSSIAGLIVFCCVAVWLIFIVGLGSTAPAFGG